MRFAPVIGDHHFGRLRGDLRFRFALTVFVGGIRVGPEAASSLAGPFSNFLPAGKGSKTARG
jgi:hypothetical protein